MSDDIVQWLRDGAAEAATPDIDGWAKRMVEAADEITRLRTALVTAQAERDERLTFEQVDARDKIIAAAAAEHARSTTLEEAAKALEELPYEELIYPDDIALSCAAHLRSMKGGDGG